MHVTSSALQVWHKRLATQQGANAFALQYANAQLQFRILYRWRVQLRVHLKRFRQARIADKFFVARRAWRIWVDRAEVRGREKRLREWNKGKARKLTASTSEQCLVGILWGLRAFGPVVWKEKALRLRRHRLAEQEIRARIDAVGTHLFLSLTFVLIDLASLLQNLLKDALGHWTNCIIVVKLRELEVVQQKNKAIVL
jgi:protein SFI1